MDGSTTRRLGTIARKLRDLAKEIDDLVKDQQIQKARKITRTKARDVVIDKSLVEDILGRGREGAKEYLSMLSHKQLGSILRAMGGSSDETKRTKGMIIERILYRMFDYAAGHRIIKGKTEEPKE